MINWKVRIKNKNFWITFIPAILILIQTIGAVFGFHIDLSDFQTKILAVVDALFIVLAIVGVVNDPTTHGLEDSTRAMTYTEPYRS